eukprot:2704327-Lingulodinium_polyedra.AAC.1
MGTPWKLQKCVMQRGDKEEEDDEVEADEEEGDEDEAKEDDKEDEEEQEDDGDVPRMDNRCRGRSATTRVGRRGGGENERQELHVWQRPGGRGLVLICVRHHCAGPPKGAESGEGP